MKEWCHLILVCIPAKFGSGILLGDCSTKFLNVTYFVGVVMFHSDMYIHHVWWLQPTWKLGYDVFYLSRDHVIKVHVTGRLGTISLFPQNLAHTLFCLRNFSSLKWSDLVHSDPAEPWKNSNSENVL